MADFLVTGSDNILRECFARMRVNAPFAPRCQVRVTATDIISAPAYDIITPATTRTVRTPQGAKTFSVGLYADGVDIGDFAAATPSAALLAGLQADTGGKVAIFWDPNSLAPQTNDTTIDVNIVDPITNTPLQPHPTAGLRYLYRANVLNGRAMARSSDGNRSFLVGAPAAWTSLFANISTTVGMTVQYCARPEGTGNQRTIYGTGAAGGAADIILTGDTVGGSGGQAYTVPGGNTGFQIVTVAGARPATGSANTHNYLFLGLGTVRSNVNGTPATYLGGCGVSNSSYSFLGDFGLIVAYSAELTTVEKIKTIRRICAYYGQPVPWAGQAVFASSDGDSYFAGTGISPTGYNNIPQQIVQLKGYSVRCFLNASNPSRAFPQNSEMLARNFQGIRAELRVDSPAIKHVHMVEGFYNDPQAAATDALAYCTSFKSVVPEATTIFLNAWDNGQTSGAAVTARAAFNVASIGAGNPFDYKVDISADLTMGVDGTCPTSGTPPIGTYFNDVQGHPTLAGATYMRDFISPTWDLAVAAAT